MHFKQDIILQPIETDNRVRDGLLTSVKENRCPRSPVPCGPLMSQQGNTIRASYHLFSFSAHTPHSFCVSQLISCYFLITSSPLRNVLFLFSSSSFGLSDLRWEKPEVCQDFPRSQMGQAWSLRPGRGLVTD